MAPLISGSEWRWVLLWTMAASLVVNVPYLFGWAVSTPRTQFGGAVYNVQDVNSYLAKMRQGARGEWLFHIPYTVEEHPGTIIYLFYLLLGKVAALTGLFLEWTFNLARLVCGALLLSTVYAFAARFTPHRAVRRIAFLLIAFSGGLGWLLTLLGKPQWLGMLPIDLILPEGYAFLTLYSSPHIALATACILWGLLRVQQGCVNDRIAPVLSGAVSFFIAALIGGFYLLVPYAVLVTHWLVIALRRRQPDWKTAGWIVLSGMLPALVIGYTYYFFASDPVYRTWAAQNLVRSPHPLHYLAGYAIVGALALLGGLWAVRRRRWQLQLPLIWVAIVPVLLYSPFNLQRRLIIGAQTPLCLLAALGLVHALALPFGRLRVVRRLSRHPRYSRAGMRGLLIAAVIMLTVPTNLLLILGNGVEVAQRKAPIFHSGAELDALDWLRTHTAPDDTVLCAYETGNYVPARAGNRVLLGLGTETIHVERKRAEVLRFFDAAQTDAWRQELLKRYQVAYVLIGPNERALGSFNPDRASYLHVVYAASSTSGGHGASADDSYTIYQVRRSQSNTHPNRSPRSSRIARSGDVRRCCVIRDLAIPHERWWTLG